MAYHACGRGHLNAIGAAEPGPRQGFDEAGLFPATAILPAFADRFNLLIQDWAGDATCSASLHKQGAHLLDALDRALCQRCHWSQWRRHAFCRQGLIRVFPLWFTLEIKCFS
ncbi:hypothetical protein [Verminephrobacter eiseniae]|uniref:hypothetical protein n=1 Tax=Verminephrobacter eiseniae TaxID=364317 RepID=UPI00223738F8|nr:hypothetical protein [Verminephrobacter eiseniae]